MTPFTGLTKTERGLISSSGPLCQYVTKPGDRAGKIQSVSPRSPPPNRRPPSRGRRCSTPVAPGLPAGWLEAATLVLSLLTLSDGIRPSGPAWCPRDSLSPPRDGLTAGAPGERQNFTFVPSRCLHGASSVAKLHSVQVNADRRDDDTWLTWLSPLPRLTGSSGVGSFGRCGACQLLDVPERAV